MYEGLKADQGDNYISKADYSARNQRYGGHILVEVKLMELGKAGDRYVMRMLQEMHKPSGILGDGHVLRCLN